MKAARIDVGRIRRGQIIDAATVIISQQGLQNLSLSEIEKQAGMSRGQLTYYFKTKEDILLAVFDRLLEMMHERAQACDTQGEGWERLQALLGHLLLSPPAFPEFGALQYTFLSQISHREDFRRRLADLYEQWRVYLSQDFADELTRRPSNRKVSPRALAVLVQAVLHGLLVQRAAEPEAYDPQEVFDLFRDLLSTYLWDGGPAQQKAPGSRSSTNGAAARRSQNDSQEVPS
ncbi:MAG: TetR/AcrR family transcriptional regulator [Planctomycetes bacterium]|nr:TetR/AcrR family transcriptional regulator [Planctomycetota bacterium]